MMVEGKWTTESAYMDYYLKKGFCDKEGFFIKKS